MCTQTVCVTCTAHTQELAKPVGPACTAALAQLTVAMLRRNNFMSPRNLATLESKTRKRHSLEEHV